MELYTLTPSTRTGRFATGRLSRQPLTLSSRGCIIADMCSFGKPLMRKAHDSFALQRIAVLSSSLPQRLSHMGDNVDAGQPMLLTYTEKHWGKPTSGSALLQMPAIAQANHAIE